ncbi:MAG: methyltransferase [Woeseiaceae bacterium]|nr:methyltransferase [Woeseiaceae bacterium]
MKIKALSVLFGLLALSVGAAMADESRMLGDELANAPGRSDEDKARDVQRKPGQVLTFLGLRKGDTVLDIWAAGGWYTEVFSIAVGPEGKVYSQNPASVLAFRDGAYEKQLSARLADDRLPNVERIDAPVADANITPGSVDIAFTALNFHDVYNRQGKEAAAEFLASIFEILKPGGALGLIDHVGDPGADNTSLHRIDPALVDELVTASGFIVEASSDLLAHPEDDHTKGVFDPTLRGETDRFIVRLRKPE